MATVPVDKAKVSRMVTQTLKLYHGSGAHPGEVVIALAESLGRVISALEEMGVSEIAQRELLDVAIKQITNAIIAGKGEQPGSIIMSDPLMRLKH